MNKYRAWDKIDKKMYEVTCIDFFHEFVEYNNGAIERQFRDVIVMQSTGLKDKNGVEIFEGDYVRKKYQSINNCNYYHSNHVVFQDKTGAWRIKYGNGTLANLFDVKKAVEVIGNKYANPELLKEV